MEQTQSTNSIDLYPPSAYTERAYGSCLAVSKDSKWTAYCVGNVIVVRSLEEGFTKCKIFSGHKVKTSAVSFSTNNYFLASADVEGNIKIFFLDDLSIKKEFPKIISGKVNGIEWNDDSTKLFIYGEGKTQMARCISWDTANNIGEISGHTKNILTGDLKKNRPYRIATGSEDMTVNFYEGTPFKFNKMHKEHTNFVTGVRFSPDGSKFVSVGFDRKIVVYDGKDGSIQFVLTEDKADLAHTGAIMSVCWLDNETIATNSLDKTVKVWSISDKICKFTLSAVEKSKLEVPHSGCAINSNGTYLINLQLDGVLNIWKISDLTDEKLPDFTTDGHQNYISQTLHLKTNNSVISGDFSGKVLLWDDTKVNKSIVNFHSHKIQSLAVSGDETTLFSMDVSGMVAITDLSDPLKPKTTLKLNGNPQNLVASKSSNNVFYALLSRAAYVIQDGQISKEASLQFEARSLGINEVTNEIYIGDIVNLFNNF
jgi:WD40 repeat protein